MDNKNEKFVKKISDFMDADPVTQILNKEKLAESVEEEKSKAKNKSEEA